MSVKATQGNVDVASFQLLSNTGTFQLDVHVFFVAAVHRAELSAGVYHNAFVTSQLVIPVIYPASLLKSDTFVGTVGTAHQSLIIFQDAPSNTAKCQSTALDGHSTSQLPHHPHHHTRFQLVQSYIISLSFTESYHKSHCAGSSGAVSLDTQFCFFASSQSM